jgi:uncharacterized membrane protein YkvI
MYSDYGKLLRTIGFSSPPGVTSILGIIPGLMNIVFVVAGIWRLVAMIIAMRQALNYRSMLRALVVCLIGWIIQAPVIFLVFSITGLPMPKTPAR